MEIFDSIAQMPTVRPLLEVVNLQWPHYWMNSKNVFLHGGLVKVVYMIPQVNCSSASC